METCRGLTVCIILGSIVLTGCNTQTEMVPTATSTQLALPTNTQSPIPTSTFTLMPTETFTPIPTNTETPTPTITPSPTPDCDEIEVLKNIKANFPYDEFEVSYHTIENLKSLDLWYMDPEIDLGATGDEIDQNAALAMRNAAFASQQLVKIDCCVAPLFDFVNPIVVDSNYNGWFSAQVDTNILTDSDKPGEDELSAIEASFEVGYYRTNAPTPLPPAQSGSCSWQETRTKIQRHFSTERENVSFYFVIDETGSNVWAQWDGPTGFLAMASILNVAMELNCLHPSPTQLFMIVVNEQGKVGMFSLLPEDGIKNLDLNQLQILYQK